MAAYLMVQAQVGEADRKDFDRWYQDEHLPDAVKAFQARSAWRGWSDVTAGVHIALYEFDSIERAREILASDAIKALIAEFDRNWQGRVTRSREIVAVKQAI